MRTRPYGSSAVAVSIGVVVLVAALIGAGVLLILNQDDDDGAQGAVPTATSEPASGADDTPDPVEPTATELEPEDQSTTPTPTSSDDPTATEPEPTPDDSDATPTQTETAVDPTATEEPVEPTEPEPTEDVPDSTPTPEPFTGEFGELPPSQLPSGGASTTLELDYQLGMSLEDLPTSGIVYRIEWPELSLAEAQAVAQRFGLAGEIVEEGVGIYRLETGDGSLFISPSETIFRASDPPTDGNLPDESTIIDSARDWLTLSGFAGSNIDSGTIVGRDDDISRAVVAFRPSNPSPILVPTPSATITIGPDGVLVEARIHWPSSLITSEYGLHAPIDLWSRVVDGQGFLEADLSGLDTSEQITGTATISDYTVAYTLAGSPSAAQYLVPVISFHGTARLDRSGEEIGVTISVPAVYAETGSIG